MCTIWLQQHQTATATAAVASHELQKKPSKIHGPYFINIPLLLCMSMSVWEHVFVCIFIKFSTFFSCEHYFSFHIVPFHFFYRSVRVCTYFFAQFRFVCSVFCIILYLIRNITNFIFSTWKKAKGKKREGEIKPIWMQKKCTLWSRKSNVFCAFFSIGIPLWKE